MTRGARAQAATAAWYTPEAEQEIRAAQPHGQIGSSDHLVQTGGKFLQHLVAGGMAVCIVDLFEIVQVQRKNGQGVSLALRASNLRRQALLGKTPVVQTGQWVNHGQIAQKVGMALLLGELAAKPLDENLLVDRIEVEKEDQRNQSKDDLG